MGYLDSTGLQKQIQYIKAYVENQISAIASNGTANRAAADGLGNNIAETYATKTELSAIPQFDIQVVNALPTANISDTTVYLVLSNSGAAGNLYTEYIHVNDTWEKLGEQTTEVDLSGYMPLSGGTLTGNIYTTPYFDATIENPEGGQTLIVSKGASTKGTLPAEDEWHTLVMAVDNTGSTNNAHKYGQIETAVRANGKIYTYLQAFKNEADSTTAASIEVGYDANGNVYTKAPTPDAEDNSTKIATTAYVNTKLSGYSTTSHTHNYAGSASAGGAATSANELATGRAIDGVTFDGSAAITHYGTCSTAAATVEKTVECASFTLVTGSRIVVKFTVTNTAASPTLNVNSTGAKAIQYHGAAISAGYLAADRTYEFVYDGTDYQLVGDINTNTTYSAGTTALLNAGTDTKNRVWPAKQISNYVENYVADKVADLVNSAPDTLDTLSELANALGDDPNFATTIATQIGNISTQVSGKVESDSANYLKSAGVSGSTLTLTKGDDTTVTFTANNYTHPTTAGNKHIPSGGSAGNILKWSSNGTAVWGDEQSLSGLFDLSSTNAQAIPQNADLNDYINGGTYYIASATIARTISHCPHTTSRSKLVVMNATTENQYHMQYLFGFTDEGGACIYTRSYGTPTTGWYAWKKVEFDDHNHNGLYPIISNSGRTEIVSDTDLNTITTPGTYFTSGGNTGSAVHQTLLNSPTNGAGGGFLMYVISTGIDSAYPKQIIYMYNGDVYERTKKSSTWGEWHKRVYEDDIQSNYVDYIKPRSVEFIKGTQTEATGAFTGITTDAALYDGKTIRYYLPYAGSGNATLNLTLSGGDTTGAKVICWTGTSQLTTQYGAGSVMTLTYVASDDKWHGADYNVNTTTSSGASNNTAKLFLVGTKAQSTGTTYSNANVYATNGALHAASISTGGNIVVGGTADTNYLQLPSGIKLY